MSFVKGLYNNLISISQLCDTDYEVHYNKKEGKMIDQKNVTVLPAKHIDHVLILFEPTDLEQWVIQYD